MDESIYIDASFDCPVCRNVVYSDEVHTNLAVKDIVEAVVAKEKHQAVLSHSPFKGMSTCLCKLLAAAFVRCAQ